ncbi:flagellar biosynthesis protein FlhA [Spirochaeta cellobiosiphila]|uniref:flagellar biosynthesis protein FlhA n=1 Tax=Spirochaeta cellobiosiphila TaxID=504483 RepID=UPI0004154C7F|nr:flagellar biosynthesis protein FlhA [Spirochaeta cellobiosiphila]
MSDFTSMMTRNIGRNHSDIFVASGVIVVIAMMLIPLPGVILDILMAFNLVLSLLIILMVLFSKRALDFSVFPTMLLITTVFGLALNVSSTRLILSKGSDFDGQLIRAFASFVVGAEGTQGLVIGILIFIIIIAVQFIVITKGATRVAEVAARFTLDALPGKQMSIDGALGSGAITEEEATLKKDELQMEVGFYGAMDGATKFVSGNVKVGLFITVINIIAGIVMGMTIRGESLDLALNTYITLTIGDGLISQFPALLVSTATGLIVTRAISDGTFGSDVSQQFTAQSKIYWIASVFLIILALLPNFPKAVLILMSVAMGVLAYRLSLKEMKSEEKERSAQENEEKAKKKDDTEMSPVVPTDPISLELGYGLIPLVDSDHGAELLDRITRIRREAALDLGLVVPRIRIIDNMRLEPAEYCIKIKGVEVGGGAIRPGQFLAINPTGEDTDLEGEITQDPTFGLPALWITEANRDRAERLGFTVVDAPSIIATHLTEIIKKHASELLGRQEVQSILDTLKRDYSAVVEEITKSFSTGEIQKVLQGLLSEQVSIRNIVVILETLGDFAAVTKDNSFLIEKVRQALSRQICLSYVNDNKVMHVITLDPQLEHQIIESKMDTTSGPVPALDPNIHRQFINAVVNTLPNMQNQGYYPIILCSEAARPLVHNATVREFPELVVLSVPEIAQDIRVESLGEIKLEGNG